MNELRKQYQNKAKKIRREIVRYRSWLKSDEANKTDLLSGYDRNVVRREIILLKKDLSEARRLLKLHTKA